MDPSSSLSPAEHVFAEFLVRVQRGDSATIDDLCRERPDLAGALQELHASWQQLEALRLRAGFGTVAASQPLKELRRTGGREVDVLVSLREPAGAGDELAEERLRRLKTKEGRERYLPLGEIARGGMGAILEVWDEDLRRTLAMKTLLSSGEETAKGVTPAEARKLGRFLEEAQITGQLDHPGIVPVHELGIMPDGRVYFTMRRVRGVDLRTTFELAQARKDGWSPTRALGVLLKVCEAMSYAHDRSVIHRDLKPANVMVGSYGEVYVMDWGLARVLGRKDAHDLRLGPSSPSAAGSIETDGRERREETPGSPLVTRDGDVLGTPAYMPPEQALGSLEQLGAWSDVYSAGAMLYELLTGQMPFVPGRSPISHQVVLARLLEGPPRPVSELAPETPPELAAICEKAMARDPRERYPDMRALAEDLRAYLEGRVVRAHESGAWAETRKWVGRNRALSLSLAAAVLLSIGVLLAQREIRAEGSRNARLEQQRRTEALQTRLVELHEDRTLGARGQELDHAAHVNRFLAEFRRAHLPLDADEEASLAAARLEQELDAEGIERVLDGLYTLAPSLLKSAAQRAPGTSPAAAADPLWSRTLALIDALERDAWRREVWSAWTALLLSGEDPPASLQAPESLAQHSARELAWLGELWWESGRREETRALFLRANELDPSSFQVHFRLGTLGIVEDDRATDIHHDRVAVALRPGSSWGWYNLGNACRARGEPYLAEAIRSYRRAIELNPAMDVAYANLAFLLPKPEGLELLRGALSKADPGNDFLVNLASIALWCNEPEPCIEAARLGIAKFPSEPRHPYHLGRGLDDLSGRDLEAAQAFTASTALDPELWQGWSNAANCFLKAAFVLPADSNEIHGLHEQALAAARCAHALRPDVSVNTRNLVAALANLGGFDEALDHLEPALRTPEGSQFKGLLEDVIDAAIETDASPDVIERAERLLSSPAVR